MKKFGYLLLFIFLGVASFLNAQVWTLSGPPSRHSQTAVYDQTTAQMIIFGGQETSSNTDLNDVWLGVTSSNQNERFTQLLPTGTPPVGRYGQVATYDPNSNRMTMFGGAEGMPAPCANDSWILDNANGSGKAQWGELSPSGTLPLARVYSSAVYDPVTDSMIVFGGNNCSTGYFDDVWVLSSANGEGGTPRWTKLSPSGTPPAARESASAIYDSVNNIMTIYGGDAGGTGFGDVWVLSNANGTGGTPVWTQLHPAGTAPGTRTGQTAVFDSSTNRMIIFGGVNAGVTLSDTWLLNSPNGLGTPSWSQLRTAGTAPSVAYHSAVYDPVLNNMFSFAGSSSADKLSTNSHAFTLFDANGVTGGGARWILGGPAVRYSQSAFYDTVTDSVFVFGGQHAKTNNDFADYWQASAVTASSNLKWTVLHPPGGAPSARFGHTGLFDSGSDRMMVFGGATGYPAPCVNDYHVLEFANTKGGSPVWVKESPTGTLPPVRSLHSSVYDSVTNTLIVFGGYDCHTTYYNDIWILKDANAVTGTPAWSKLAPTGAPPGVRESSSAVYDSTTNTLIVFGGDAGGSSQFGDIWLLSNANGTGGTPAWSVLTPSNKGPATRSGHSATYDSVHNVMTIYGGYHGGQILTDVWILDAANGHAGAASWVQSLVGQPRRFQSAMYDTTLNEMITYGGQTSTNPLNPTSDIWILSDANGLK
ncbi:MAG TPA: kelch repeat-containing protein [Candidatus Sulfotelmatobacter sp.]|jgi:hypothetical protein